MTKHPGTSTCTILMIDSSNAKLYSSFIGDSSYLILRYDELEEKYYKIYRSPEQMHSECFNMPYQVGKEGDDPENAQVNSHQLKNEDMIILATDG